MRLVVAHVCSIPETFRFFEGVFSKLTGPDLRVVIAAGGNRDVLAAFAAGEQVEFRHLKLSRDGRLIGLLNEAISICWWLHEVRPDVVHSHTPKAVLLATIGSSIVGIRCRIVHLHGFPADTARGAKRFALLCADALAMACAHHVIAVGESIRRKAQRLASCVNEERVRVIGNGSASGIDAENRFSPERFSEADRQAERSKFGLPIHVLAVCFIGRFAQDKGIDVLATAWGLVRSAHPDAWLVMVGGVDGRAPVNEESLATLRLHKNVIFTGNVSDVERILAIVDVVVLPTLREGLPYVPLEAGSMAVPVIASDIPECAEVIRDGVTGTLVPVRSPTALASAIGRYIADQQLRNTHGAAARCFVQTRFGRSFVRAKFFAWYETLIKSLKTDIGDVV